jgi:tetratricopeptide (TPR) repeat protein/HEAT repeat protein
VRFGSVVLLLAVLWAVLLWAPSGLAQDFDPRGPHRVHGSPQAAPIPKGPAGQAPGSPEALIERYTRIVLSQPGAAFPLERLAQLYRDRDGNIRRLIGDFEARAARAAPDEHAATVALAGLYKIDGRPEEASSAYERAIALNGKDPGAVLALARLLVDRGQIAEARTRYEQALLLQTARADKEQTLRALMGLALDAADWSKAQQIHDELVKLEPTSLFVKGELGRELFRRGEYARAEHELSGVVAAAAGDNRVLGPALKELGEAQAKAGEAAKALETLKRALVAAGPEPALRAEIEQVIAQVYRAEQRLPELIEELERAQPNDTATLTLLGGLYEETGDTAKASRIYERVLAIDPRQVDVRLRLVRVLQATGDLDRAIAQYDALIRADPNNTQFVFEACDALLQRGERPRALGLLTALEARAGDDEEVLSRVADFYSHMGESDRSLRTLQRLAARHGSDDPEHIADLGDRYFQDGKQALAVQTWKGILSAVEPRAKALATLGKVYAEHDLSTEAIAAYKEAAALEPANLDFKRALAGAYERAQDYAKAAALYEEVVAKASTPADRALARECEARLVTLWSFGHVLEEKLPILRRRFAADPTNVEAASVLAEALVHLRQFPEAEAVLRQIMARRPGEPEPYVALERLLVQDGKIADAIKVLESLAEVQPKRARELYERMARYASQIYRDDDAIRYAVRAVELNPDDADGHRRLAEMYRSRQDAEHAIFEFRAAIARNDHLFDVYLELAELLLARGQAAEADRLYRTVVRKATDEELVARAARLSMQTSLGQGSLAALEQDLLPLAIGNPQKAVYRHLLVELYGNLTFALVQRVRNGDATDAAEARTALTRIGARAVKPLLDALADTDVTQQRIAIDVLAYVDNPHAALPLLTFAMGSGDVTLRTRAMLACGAIADGSLAPKIESLLFPKQPGADSSESVSTAAAWSLVRMNDRRALASLRRLAFDEGPPPLRALAVLGLGFSGDTASLPRLSEWVRAPSTDTLTRAAAAYALGDLGGATAMPTLLELAQQGEGLPLRMALLALARLAANREGPAVDQAVQAMAFALFTGPREAEGPAVSRTAATTLAIVVTRGSGANGWARMRETLPSPGEALDVEALLDELAPRDADASAREAALVAYAEPLRQAAIASLLVSSDRARAVLGALGSGEGELLPLSPPGGSAAAIQAGLALDAALGPSLVALAKHPDPDIVARALPLIARSSADEATDALVAGLRHKDDTVERAALGAVGGPPATAGSNRRTLDAVSDILSGDHDWAMRVLAARALGRLGRIDPGRATPPLQTAAIRDAYAFVRQAALDSLASFDAADARALAARIVEDDPEPRVRQAAEDVAR